MIEFVKEFESSNEKLKPGLSFGNDGVTLTLESREGRCYDVITITNKGMLFRHWFVNTPGLNPFEFRASF